MYLKYHLVLTALLSVLSLVSHAQQISPPPPQRVGIQTREATETLDVNGTVKVQRLPKRGEHIYNGAPTPSTPFEPKYRVVADANGVLGVDALEASGKPVFILPKLYLPLSTSYAPFYYPVSNYGVERFFYHDGQSFFFGLSRYSELQLQVGVIGASDNAYRNPPGIARSNSSVSIGYLGFTFYSNSINSDFSPTKMSYYVTYYDTDVYTDVRIINDPTRSYRQVLTYKVKPNAKATSKTYMNIVMMPR